MPTVRLNSICRWLLGLAFLVAGAMKIAHPAAFFADLLSYRVPFPEILLRAVAIWLPWLEVLCAAGLLLNRWPETVRPVVMMLCLVFVLMLGQAVARGLDLNCGCFGAGRSAWLARPGVALGRAALLLAAAIFLTAESPAPRTNSNQSPHQGPPTEGA